jgi:hypothetical protein
LIHLGVCVLSMLVTVVLTRSLLPSVFYAVPKALLGWFRGTYSSKLSLFYLVSILIGPILLGARSRPVGRLLFAPMEIPGDTEAGWGQLGPRLGNSFRHGHFSNLTFRTDLPRHKEGVRANGMNQPQLGDHCRGRDGAPRHTQAGGLRIKCALRRGLFTRRYPFGAADTGGDRWKCRSSYFAEIFGLRFVKPMLVAFRSSHVGNFCQESSKHAGIPKNR